MALFLKPWNHSAALFSCLVNIPWNYSHDYIACVVREDLVIRKDFVSREEEENLVNELNGCLSKHKFESSHWDYAITHYREIERTNWLAVNRPIIQRLKEFTATTIPNESAKGFSVDQLIQPSIHVLDLADNGEIRAHVDSVRFCGGSVAVISLLSDSVLRLAVAPPQEVVALPVDQPNLRNLALPTDGWLDVFIPRRSIYVLRGGTRYLLTHEILSNEKVSELNMTHPSPLYSTRRSRRISVICRSRNRFPLLSLTPEST